ncbi:hypothetical protein AN958_08172 [Leucoagaricus sp. SymC.cos]|nr:hypothetical protein AN958_08172 [Leucoagaricus sp. SymC.cos]
MFSGFEQMCLAGLDKENPEKYSEAEHRGYKTLVQVIPNFADTLSEFSLVPEKLNQLISMMGEWADAARNEDTGVLLHNSFNWMLLDPETDKWPGPIPMKKSNRGFKNIMTARHLTPVEHLDGFDADPSAYMQKVNDGEIIPTATEPGLCSFLYDLDMVDPENPNRGFLRGYFLLRCARAIFTGKSSALGDARAAAKDSKAEIHGVKRLTAPMIAYVIVHARHTLGSRTKWGEKDGAYDYSTLHELILRLLSDENDIWVKETFEWWNSQLPDLRRSSKRKTRSMADIVDAQKERAISETHDRFLAARRQQALGAQQSSSQTGPNSDARQPVEPNPDEHEPDTHRDNEPDDPRCDNEPDDPRRDELEDTRRPRAEPQSTSVPHQRPTLNTPNEPQPAQQQRTEPPPLLGAQTRPQISSTQTSNLDRQHQTDLAQESELSSSEDEDGPAKKRRRVTLEGSKGKKKGKGASKGNKRKKRNW